MKRFPRLFAAFVVAASAMAQSTQVVDDSGVGRDRVTVLVTPHAVRPGFVRVVFQNFNPRDARNLEVYDDQGPVGVIASRGQMSTVLDVPMRAVQTLRFRATRFGPGGKAVLANPRTLWFAPGVRGGDEVVVAWGKP